MARTTWEMTLAGIGLTTVGIIDGKVSVQFWQQAPITLSHEDADSLAGAIRAAAARAWANEQEAKGAL